MGGPPIPDWRTSTCTGPPGRPEDADASETIALRHRLDRRVARDHLRSVELQHSPPEVVEELGSVLPERDDEAAADHASRVVPAQAWPPGEVHLLTGEPDVAGKLLDLLVRELGADPVESGRDEAPEGLAMAWDAQLLGCHECGDVFALLVVHASTPWLARKWNAGAAQFSMLDRSRSTAVRAKIGWPRS